MSKKKKVAKKAKPLTAIEAKRVAILKDAIAQVRAKKYLVEANSGYVDNGTNALPDFHEAAESCKLFTGKEADEVEFNKYLDNIITKDNPCQVCAKGAMLLSSIRKFNNFTLQDADDTNLNALAGDDGTYEIFGQKNADKMECYFERQDDDIIINANGEASCWSDDYPNDDKRLIAIFENAIKHRGTFTP